MDAYPEVEIDHDALKKIIDKRRLGMAEILKIEEEPAVKEGENYGSVIHRVKIQGLGHGGHVCNKTVVLKKDKQFPPETRENLHIFKDEIQMYSDIFPKYKEIIDGTVNKGDLEAMWADCFGTRNHDAILLEDLNESGYIMRNRKAPLNPELAVYCGGRLGQFHALSLAAVRRKMVDPQTLPSNRLLRDTKIFNSIFSGGLTALADTLQSSWGQEWHSAVPKLRDLASKTSTELQKLGEKVKGKFSVINHGDCWSNNMMFKFSEDSSLPLSLKFVDYQMSHYSSFAWDLTYILHSNVTANDRALCYNPFMEHYRGSLVETLRRLGEDVSQVPDLEWMHSVMKELNLFALLAAFCYFPIIINTLEEGWDLDKSIKKSSSTHNMKMYENPILEESFKLDLVRFKNEGLL